MNAKLDNVTTQYRKFNENQVLTEGQLNEFIYYFEDQDRLSRTRLSGVGVVCGFKSTYIDFILQPDVTVEKISQPEIEIEIPFQTIMITQGAGVTTDGDLITLRRKGDKTSDATVDFDTNIYKYYREYDDVVRYEHFRIGDTQIPLLELFTQEEYNELIDVRNVRPTREIRNINDKVIILYLESYSNEESPCEDADCDNTGAEQVSNLKVLLADSASVSDLIARGDAKDTIYKAHNAYEELFDHLPKIEAKRVILDTEITTALQLKSRFQNAISAVSDLSEGFSAIASTFNVSVNLSGQSLLDKLNSLLLPVVQSRLEDYQYRYDLLKDLIDTYNEIKGLILHLNVECCPSIASFPKHLMLGPVGASLELGEYAPFRHGFYNSPVTTNDDENYEKVVMLANRFVQKLNGFQSYIGPVKITPSNLYVRLGDKAIPYYYNVDKPLLDKWNFEKTKTDRENYNLSYHTTNLAAEDFVQNPLNYNIDDNDFYRIEGHLGLPYKTALQNINDLKTKYGLAFDVIALVLKKGEKPDDVPREKTVSIEDLRKQLVSISSDISNQKNDSQSTLLNISKLDSQLRLLNQAEFSKEGSSEVTVVKQDPKRDDVVSELLSEFLERKSGLEHVAGVEPGGTFVLIYESEINNQVLADFSLPYLCCSKKDPVFLTLPETKLCQNDDPMTLTIVPLDGEVKAFVNGTQLSAITQSGGQSMFDPGLVSSAYFGQTITFTVNDDAVEAQLIVYEQPNVTLTIQNTVYNYTDNEATVYFLVTNNGSDQISNYHWNYGDSSTDNLIPNSSGLVAHVFPITPNENSTYHTILNAVAENTGCSTQVAVNVELSGLQLVSCSQNFNYSGSDGIYEYNIDFGTDTGTAGINYDAYDMPDRFIIEWNGQTYDSGFRGSSAYNSQLISAGVNPANINTANPANGSGSLTFNKNTALPRFAKITVLAPLGGTAWNVSGICPNK